MKNLKLLSTFSILVTTILSATSDDLYNKSLNELLNLELEPNVEVGSRDKSRALNDSAVAIDVITSKEIEKTGYTELTKVLQRFIPSFNYPRVSIRDGSDHQRPFTLRGLNPDQILVLINGKRVHTTALMHVNNSIGRGSSGVDLNTIALHSIDRVEILRDGAAAQYGSDAIAGVINIILKADGYKNQFSSTIGETKEGDGRVYQSDLFYSIPLKYDGFLNITLESRDRNPTNRAGVDSRVQYPNGNIKNNLEPSVNMRYGDSDAKDLILVLNADIPQENGNSYYIHSLLNKRDSEAGAYRRRAVDDRNSIEIYPDGFLPLISTKVLDYSLTLGMNGFTENSIKWDLSNTIGYNEMGYYLRDSLNKSLGLESPTSFYNGELNYLQNSINLDLSKKFSNFNISGGTEIRYENFGIEAGDRESYIIGNENSIGGSQGFPGFREENEIDENRQNYALYLDINYQLTKKLSINGASRYEYYTDFGSTIDSKIALLHKTDNDLSLRGSFSTGFRAPSLSQNHFNATTTVFTVDNLYETGTFGVDHPLAKALGAKDLKPEKSKHFTTGFIYQPNSNLSFTLDYFYTKIDDRIILSENIDSAISDEVQNIFDTYKIGKARFFTNAISSKTDGFDLRANYNYTLENSSKLNFGIWYNYTKNRILSINNPPDILGAKGDDIIIGFPARGRIEDGQPSSSMKILTNYELNNLNIALNLNRYGTFQHLVSEEFYQKFGAEWITDIDISYQLNDKFNIAIGSHNLFDIYPDKWEDSKNEIFAGDSIIPYSQYSPFGFNGAFYYFRLKYEF